MFNECFSFLLPFFQGDDDGDGIFDHLDKVDDGDDIPDNLDTDDDRDGIPDDGGGKFKHFDKWYLSIGTPLLFMTIVSTSFHFD